MKAFLKNYRQSPRKVRLVTDLIKGTSVSQANLDLEMMPKRASLAIKKLLMSAVSNAKNLSDFNQDNLYVQDIRVDEGKVLKRFRPRAMGRSAGILKRSSRVSLLLGERKDSKVKAKSQK